MSARYQPSIRTLPERRTAMPVMPAIAAAVVIATAGCASAPAEHAAPLDRPLREPVLIGGLGEAEGHYALGRYHAGARAWDSAVVAYRLAIAADPTLARAHNALGVALAQLGRYEEAETVLRRAALLDPVSAMVQSNLGWVILLAGHARDALPPLREAVRLDPADPVAQANLREAGTQWEQVQAAQAQGTVTDARSRVAQATPVASEPAAALVAPASDRIVVPDVAPAAIAVAAPITAVAVPEPFGSGATERFAMLAVRRPVPAAPTVAAQVVDTPTVESLTAPPRVPAASLPPAPVAERSLERGEASARRAAAPAKIELSNGNGTRGMAARLGRWLATRGVAAQRLTNRKPFDQQRTVVQYRPGQEEAARRVVAALPIDVDLEAMASSELQADVRVVLGHDLQSASTCAPSGHCQAVLAMLSDVRSGVLPYQ